MEAFMSVRKSSALIAGAVLLVAVSLGALRLLKIGNRLDLFK